MHSLRQRLTISLAASLALFFVVQILMVGNAVETLSERNLLTHLKHDQEQILASLQWAPPAAPELRQKFIPGIYQRPFSGHYFQIDLPGASLRSRSLWDEQLPPTTGQMVHDVPGPEGQRLLVWQNTVQFNGRPVTIRTAENILPIEHSIGKFQRHLLLVALAAVIALMLLQSWLTRRSLQPLHRIRMQINRLKSGDLGQIDAPTPEEITPLVDEFNHLIQLMQQRLQRSRHSLGDLAHSLKTPLAVARQISRRQADSEDRRQLDEQLQRIEQRIERELARARTAGRMPGGQWSTPAADLGDLADMLRHAFPDVRIELQLDRQLKIPADREDMLEIFGNLLENACKWAASVVRCRVWQEDDKTRVCIEDDGPGIKTELYDKLLARGERADESRPGHGLGLSIVSEMVATYEGSIELGRSTDLLGLKVNIILP